MSWTSRLASWFKPSSAAAAAAPLGNYQSWTRQQLIDRLRLLESSTLPAPHHHHQHQQHHHRPTCSSSVHALQRPFEFNAYPHHRIALKVAYVGWRYLGFAAQKDTQQTVEAALFQALQATRLIEDPELCDFTRCGRTDKGVSGLGQVVALNVRQSSTKQQPSDDSGTMGGGGGAMIPRGMPYVEILNNVLPDDIRILAWSPVSPAFNARFDCVHRTYKYMFLKQDLDVAAMQQAAARMVGTHDFRHFCKLDPSKQLNHLRTIHAIDIQPSHLGGKDAYEVVICGSAFLWHQVRCIMSVLLLVGQRLEPVTIVDSLLDPRRPEEGKPDYPLASDVPLVLWDCTYPPGALDWQAPTRPYRLHQHFDDAQYDQTVRAWIYQSFANHVQQPAISSIDNDPHAMSERKTVVLGAGQTIRSTKYRPLLQRARADSDQVKREKYQAKLERKKQRQMQVDSALIG
ncbi:pseudouridine synthase [Absidia repens]|uniref:tRNA pseudouridine synthase n=1 Tax=Absidia repens TaxID=90262 RepID=A0A1X2I146_9FUNG|nr:pseudouridine synthase [Absidia repens]